MTRNLGGVATPRRTDNHTERERVSIEGRVYENNDVPFTHICVFARKTQKFVSGSLIMSSQFFPDKYETITNKIIIPFTVFYF